MKKLIIALVAFSIVFTACTLSNSGDGKTDLNVSIESVETTEKSSVEEPSSINTANNEAIDDSQDLLGEFDILVHHDYDFSKLTYKSAEIRKNATIEAIVKDTFFSEDENPEYYKNLIQASVAE